MSSTQAEAVNLLLVDDDPASLTALEALLSRPGLRFFTATSGPQALKIALKEKIAVILLDVVMPHMDGFEVARHLKALERTRDVPLLFLTAIATDSARIYRAYECGAVDYVIKPVDSEIVRRKVAVFVELVRQREVIARHVAAEGEARQKMHDLQLTRLRIAADARYRRVLEGISSAVTWETDQELRLTFISQRAGPVFGFPGQSIEPDFWLEHLFPADREATLGVFRTALDEGTELVCDHRLVTSDGSVKWFHTGVSGEVTPGGRELHGISVDVTALTRAREDAERATQVREELLAIVAHDLRNPLSSIKIGTGLLLQDVARLGGRAERTAKTILRSVDRMERLIGDLLDFAQLRSGRVTLEKQRLDAASLVRETVEMFRPLAEERKLRLVGDAPEPIELDCDRDRVLQILSNLVGNALKFTPSGSVAIEVEREGADAVFTVADTGRGLSEEEVQLIWDRYQHAKKRTGGGVGLGLSIARGLVEAHGGRIWVESTPSEGTTFHFTIPISQPAEETGWPRGDRSARAPL